MPFILRRTKEAVLSDLPPKILQVGFCATPHTASIATSASNLDAPSVSAACLHGTSPSSLAALLPCMEARLRNLL